MEKIVKLFTLGLVIALAGLIYAPKVDSPTMERARAGKEYRRALREPFFKEERFVAVEMTNRLYRQEEARLKTLVDRSCWTDEQFEHEQQFIETRLAWFRQLQEEASGDTDFGCMINLEGCIDMAEEYLENLLNEWARAKGKAVRQHVELSRALAKKVQQLNVLSLYGRVSIEAKKKFQARQEARRRLRRMEQSKKRVFAVVLFSDV